jgi:hypothetical protein
LQDFSQLFDGSKDNIEDLQLEVTEDSISQDTRLSQEGEQRLKDAKIEGMP